MSFYIYIIQSDADGSYYKGFSEQPVLRLGQHNNGESRYTSYKTPWRLVHIEEHPSKREALIREKAIKKFSHAQIQKLILTEKNIISKFVSSAG